uniref:Basigin n=1 Tax=Zonotrichia albicollis TaxID=44394 RepID=A0A8D2NKB0_ZONAL
PAFHADVTCAAQAGECGAGFIKSPLSQKRLAQDSVELYCEAIGNPIPEIQWWFEGNDPNETHAQLWDGARQDRVKINATYNLHSTSTISIANLTADDSGMYECRASNDPDRNHLSKSPKVKWIRSQANVFVIERPDIATNFLVDAGKVTLWCNMSDPQHTITGHKWVHKEKTLKEDNEPGASTSYTDPAAVQASRPFVWHCRRACLPIATGIPPQVTAYKKSEHGNEGDTGVLTCKNPSYPAVTTWSWHKSGHGVSAVIFSISPPAQSLRHQNYSKFQCSPEKGGCCWGGSVLSLSSHPFSLPRKSNATNHKDKNVRQRNAN